MRRAFSWGKRRHWNFLHDTNIYKALEARSSTLKSDRFGNFHYGCFGDRGHSNYRYSSSRGWWLRVPGRKPGDGWGKFSLLKTGKSIEEAEEDWKELIKKQEQVEKEFQEFKRKVDADPYKVLFGWRSQTSPKPEGKSSSKETTSEEPTFPNRGDQAVGNTVPNPTSAGKKHSQELEARLHPSYLEERNRLNDEEQAEEFVFDPITMRKVPKKPSRPVPDLKENMKFVEEESSIPVKRFSAGGPPAKDNGSPSQPSKEAPSKQSPSPESRSAAQSHRPVHSQPSWLAQEGFGAPKPGVKAFRPGSEAKQPIKDIHSKPTRLESTLERYIRRKEATPKESSTDPSVLENKGQENKIQDAKQLPASGVDGFGSRSPKQTEQEGRKDLDDNYLVQQQQLENRLAQEYIRLKAQRAKDAIQLKTGIPSSSRLVEKHISDGTHHLKLREGENRKKNAAKITLEKEVAAQIVAMEAAEVHSGSKARPSKAQHVDSQESGEGDLRSNVHEFADRDRWYKQRAPHAMDKSELRLKQRVKDMALIREIRSIYEDAYGTINTQHRQPSRQDNKWEKVEKIQKRVQTSTGPSSLNISRPLTSSTKKDQPQRHEVLGIIRKLVIDLRQTRSLCRRHFKKYPHVAVPNEIFRSARAFEKSFIQTLKGALDIYAPGVELPADAEVEARKHDTPATAIVTSVGEPRANDIPATAAATSVGESGVNGIPITAAATSVGDSEANSILVTLAATSVGESETDDVSATAAATSVDESELSSIPKPILAQVSKSSTPILYKILAYDPSTQKVSAAKTTSMATALDENPLTLVEALSKVATPAKFLPHFASLQNSGYEVISAGTNILIFRKFGSTKPPTLHVTEDTSFNTTEKYPRHTNPIDGTTTRTGNFASPTGFVNHDAILPPEDYGPPLPPYSWNTKAKDKVTRQEEVFSGSRTHWQDDHKAGGSNNSSNGNSHRKSSRKWRRAERRKNTLKRMLKLGVWVAAFCYVIGVVMELFRI